MLRLREEQVRGVNEITWGLGRLQLQRVSMEGMENWWNWGT